MVSDVGLYGRIKGSIKAFAAETPPLKCSEGPDTSEGTPATPPSLISLCFLCVPGLKEIPICILKRNDQNQLSALLCKNESDYRLWWAPASCGLVALTIFEVSCRNFIRRILSGISGAC